ncbi:DUF3010 family protein [Vibrio coralliirubri]|nr:DUF3010 family protein [Vibrio coralliirubri]
MLNNIQKENYKGRKMKVCGIEIKGNDAVVCFLQKEGESTVIIPSVKNKISVGKTGSAYDIRAFQDEFEQLMRTHGSITAIIKERQTKGKFAGGAMSFKIESAIQLIRSIDVHTVSIHQIKKCNQAVSPTVKFQNTDLKQYQEQAYVVANYGLFGDL